MRVLVLAGATYAEPSTRRMFDHIAAHGVEVVLAMPRRIEHPFTPAEVPETPWPTPGVRLVRLDCWYSHRNMTHVLLRGLPRLIRECRPDIIHCVMEPWSVTCLQAERVIPTLAKRPLLGIQPAETKPEQGGRLAGRVRTALYRRSISRCDYLVGWSTKALDVASRLGLNGLTGRVFPAVGVDTDLFHPATLEDRAELRSEMGLDTSSRLLVGFVGRFSEEKGVADLIEAMDAVAAPGISLAMMGDGPLAGRALAAAATRPWLKILPPRDQAGVARFMRALDLLAVPSRTTSSWEEQFGLVLVEAMACGLPIVASTSGAIPEVLGSAGWIFREGDVSELAGCLRRADSSKDERGRLGAFGRRRVESHYSSPAIADRLVTLWASLREREAA
ncbi:MAG TPA: glycosyltransferase [Candidatus Polarisedimenticolia bacterium]|nr:glycosyltransferase [Candidatus Polarisedimenticolia bacterium]